ncbi:pyridoxamine 5'-phosphate oxidase [Shumkonia mesophila]|uniref:pyridoxamine 5'-phosphate oxidase n=1 Tax=Shumkonia mesophila TaxID=2838854 RepID=UPI0029352282|nr:pyridoxamine 5'-phosphate oxidase [Shumkonia mesophila]
MPSWQLYGGAHRTVDGDTAAVTNDPFGLFRQWLADAEKSEPNDPNAMALATADAEGRPSVRMVLLKGVDERGFVFYTNLTSRKGQQLAANPRVGLCFHWKTLRKQVNVEGPVSPVDAAEADAYFASRDRGSQIGAWASKQSQPLDGRFALEGRVAQFAAKFHVGTVPRPEFWSGFRVVPERIEFWEDRPFRLHNRLVFQRTDGAWQTQNLFP